MKAYSIRDPCVCSIINIIVVIIKIMNSRLPRITQLLDDIWCVRDHYYEPVSSLNKFCRDCIINLGFIAADVESVRWHKVVFNPEGICIVRCHLCQVILTTVTRCQSDNCTRCVSQFRYLLSSISDAEFNLISENSCPVEAIHEFDRRRGRCMIHD